MPPDNCARVPTPRTAGGLPSFLTRESTLRQNSDYVVNVSSVLCVGIIATPSVDTHTLSEEERAAAVDFRLNLLGMFGGIEQHKWDQGWA